MDIMEEIDPNFEPQSRPRSSTWPLRRPDFLDNKPQASPAIAEEEPQHNGEQPLSQQCHEPPPAELTALTPEPIGLVPEVIEPLLGDNKHDSSTPNKKNTSRRNAWGNLSYADLITKAVQSSPEQRLTLSQIYEWMVKNVAYFKDKGDSNSSAGWKNSIRHNLSLHSRFVRVQNEGTGKSSWWMINPDAKPGKARRRSSSMETKNSNWEKKRGRAKKKVEAERAAKWPNSPNSTDVDFPLDSPFDNFRSRASSNASSCGRLSPIMANLDHDGPPLSPATSLGPPPPSYESSIGSELSQVNELTESIAESMNLSTSSSLNSDQLNSSVEQMHLRQSNGLYHNQNGGNNYIFSPPGSGYNSSQPSPAHSGTSQSPFSHYSCTSQSSALSPQHMSQQRTPSMTNLSEQFPMMHQSRINYTNVALTQSESMITQTSPIMSSEDGLISHGMLQEQMPPAVLINQRNQMMPTCRNQSLNLPTRNLTMSQAAGPSQLSALLTMPGPYNRYQTSNLQQQIHPVNGINGMPMPALQPHFNNEALQNDRFPQDLDLDMFQDELHCDMDSIIRSELDMGEGFDFNFDQPAQITPTGIQQSLPNMMQTNANGNVNRNWVH